MNLNKFNFSNDFYREDVEKYIDLFLDHNSRDLINFNDNFNFNNYFIIKINILLLKKLEEFRDRIKFVTAPVWVINEGEENEKALQVETLRYKIENQYIDENDLDVKIVEYLHKQIKKKIEEEKNKKLYIYKLVNNIFSIKIDEYLRFSAYIHSRITFY